MAIWPSHAVLPLNSEFRETDRYTGRQTDRQKDRQTGGTDKRANHAK